SHVPAPVGALHGRWPDPAGGTQEGHLAFAQEFLPGVEDAWRVAVRAARDGAPFTREAAGLVAAVASVHRGLAAAFPTEAPTAAGSAALRETWDRRARAAVQEVPELERYVEAVTAAYARAGAAPWPHQQRIHGDLHLGQVLDAPGRGWVLLDFEGEP